MCVYDETRTHAHAHTRTHARTHAERAKPDSGTVKQTVLINLAKEGERRQEWR